MGMKYERCIALEQSLDSEVEIRTVDVGEMHGKLCEEPCGVRDEVVQCGSTDTARDARAAGPENSGGFGGRHVAGKFNFARAVEVGPAIGYPGKQSDLFSVVALIPELFSPPFLQCL